jgi:hypothetical protein
MMSMGSSAAESIGSTDYAVECFLDKQATPCLTFGVRLKWEDIADCRLCEISVGTSVRAADSVWAGRCFSALGWAFWE